MHVILTPGYLAPASIMWPISRVLQKHRHRPSIFSYATYRGHIEEHADALAQHIDATIGESPFAMVGHSLGGLLTHTVLPRLRRPPERLVFIATPHQGCERAQKARVALYARFFTGPARRAAQGVPLGHHGISTGVIYGRKDRIVRPAEAKLEGAIDLELPFGHNELLLRAQTAHAVLRFLTAGHFHEGLDKEKILKESANPTSI